MRSTEPASCATVSPLADDDVVIELCDASLYVLHCEVKARSKAKSKVFRGVPKAKSAC